MFTLEDKEKLSKESCISEKILCLAGVARNNKAITGISYDGIAFPYYDLQWKLLGYRVRLDSPIDGMKYNQKKGTNLNMYCIRDNISKVKDPSMPLLITEGEKKALALETAFQGENYAICAVPGCWNWVATGTGELSEIWSLVPMHERTVYLVLDSDIYTNYSIFSAYRKFANALLKRGALLHFVDLRERL